MRKYILVLFSTLLLATPALAKQHRHHPFHRSVAGASYSHHHHRIAGGHSAGSGRLSLAGFPEPLVEKVHEITGACGSRIVSAFRPGARVAGTGHISNHALRKAVDIAGNPKCIYAHLQGWPGGYSIDYGRVQHVHISYNRGMEWGVRFAHGGGGHYARRYAHHHHRTHYAAG